MDILVKVSGSLTRDKKFYTWLAAIYSSFDNLFIICGGGEPITKILEDNNIPFKFGPQGREIQSLEGRRLAQQVLEGEMAFVERKLQEIKIKAVVLIPEVKVNGKILHINGDNYALALYSNFDKTYFITKEGRTKSFPENLNKIEVVYLQRAA